ncbi:hypothetical protein PG984_016045 [Apiospora sp. TS-2023a]
MAPSTRSKAAAASSAPPSSAKQPASQPKPTRQTRRAAEQKAAKAQSENTAVAQPDSSRLSTQSPQNSPSDEDQISADPVKKMHS